MVHDRIGLIEATRGGITSVERPVVGQLVLELARTGQISPPLSVMISRTIRLTRSLCWYQLDRDRRRDEAAVVSPGHRLLHGQLDQRSGGVPDRSAASAPTPEVKRPVGTCRVSTQLRSTW